MGYLIWRPRSDVKTATTLVLAWALAATCLVGASAAANPERRDIHGYVADIESGEALPYATVAVTGMGRGAHTNPDGYFVIVDVPARACTLEVTYIGYHTGSVPVGEHALGPEGLKIELRVQAVGVGETVVAAERQYEIWKPAEEVSQITLSPRQLDFLPALGENDVFRSLQLLPGISGASEGSSGLYVRGGTPDQNLILFDGMTVYHIDHFFGLFSAFNADAIKDIQVYKGGFPAKYGGRLSSVVELTGKTGDANELRVAGAVNLLSARLLMEAPLWGMGSWVVSLRRSYTDIIESGLYQTLFDLSDQESSGPAAPQFGRGSRRLQTQEVNPLFYFYDLSTKASISPTPRDFLSLSLYSGRDNLDKSRSLEGLGLRGAGGGTTTSATGTRVEDNLTDWGNLGVSVKWGRQWHSRLFTNLLVSSSVYSSEYARNSAFEGQAAEGAAGFRSAAQYEEDNEVRDTSLRLDGEWQVHAAHKISTGLAMTALTAEYTATFGDTIDRLDVASQGRQMAVYLQDEWSPISTLEITAGVRGTHHDQTDSVYVAPRLSAAWYLTDRVKVKGAWGQYYQFVNNISSENILQGRGDFWLVADENMQPGSSEHRIVGLSYETDDILLEVEGYDKDLEGLVEFSRRAGRRLPADYLGSFFFGEGSARGVEFLAQKKRGPVSGWISYTLGQVRQRFPNLNDGETFAADHDRRHEVKWVGSCERGPWRYGATWVYASGGAYTAPESYYAIDLIDGNSLSFVHVGERNASRLPAYHRMDVSVSRAFEAEEFDWRAGVSIFNLYGRSNIQGLEYDFEVTPAVATDVALLGFTPTIFVKAQFR